MNSYSKLQVAYLKDHLNAVNDDYIAESMDKAIDKVNDEIWVLDEYFLASDVIKKMKPSEYERMKQGHVKTLVDLNVLQELSTGMFYKTEEIEEIAETFLHIDEV